MLGKIPAILRILFTVIFIMSLIPIVNYTTLAKKKKKVKKEAVRSDAIKLIRENSESICELAGINPMHPDSMNYSNGDTIIGEYGEDLEELENEDDVTVDMEMFKNLWLSYATSGESDFTSTGINKTDLMDEIMEWLGTRYKFGGTSAEGIDCSAFMRHLFLKTNEIMLPRTARDQYTIGKDIKRNKLEFGDLVFFHTRRRVYISHVGMYLGDNLFAHASSRYGVTVSSLESTYYNKRFIGAKRLSVEDLRRFSIKSDKLDKSSM